MEEKKITHVLMPEHRLISEEEKEQLLQKFNVGITDIPIILTTDPMVKNLGAKPGDVIEIRRKSETAGESLYYRHVVS